MLLVVADAANLLGEQVVDAVRKLLVELGRRRLISMRSAADIAELIVGNVEVNCGVVDSVVVDTTTMTTLSELRVVVIRPPSQ